MLKLVVGGVWLLYVEDSSRVNGPSAATSVNTATKERASMRSEGMEKREDAAA